MKKIVVPISILILFMLGSCYSGRRGGHRYPRDHEFKSYNHYQSRW